MYSAENSSSSYPLSYHQLSSSFTISENTNIFLQTQQNHPQTTLHEESFTHLPFSLTSPPPISPQNPNIINTMQPNSSSFHSPLNASFRQENEPNWGCLRGRKKPLTKKDRHTKISTAQGIRDRRVRLSINIAREFFNLQDLLGFDKASKTLGWLLSKSKAAIDELVRASSSTKEEDIKQQELTKGSQSNISKKKREKKDLDNDQGNCGDQNSEREARRAKARARARERTKNKKKMMMKIMIPHQDDDHYHHHNFVNQRAHNNLMDQQPCYGATPQNKLIRSSGSSNYNYNCIDHHHRQAGFDNNQYISNNNNDYLMKLALESTPGISAFNIINLSTEIHINAKPWENRVNQVQY